MIKYWYVTLNKDMRAFVSEGTYFPKPDDAEILMGNNYNDYFNKMSGNFFLTREDAEHAADTIDGVFKRPQASEYHPKHVDILYCAGRITKAMYDQMKLIGYSTWLTCATVMMAPHTIDDYK